MIQPARKYSASDAYRYGFNGKEDDNEVKGKGNQQDYGMRIYDPRLGRFLSVDPISKEYPELTPYQFASNTPIMAIDMDGLESLIPVLGGKTTPVVRITKARHVGSQVKNSPNAKPLSSIRNWNNLRPEIQELLRKADIGKQEHGAWRPLQEAQGYQTEVPVRGGRIDAFRLIERAGKIIGQLKEFKPNNPAAIERGISQLNRYITELAKNPKFKHVQQFIGTVETYSSAGIMLTHQMEIMYEVQKGDNLTKIAAGLNTTVDELACLNNIQNVNVITPGQKLKLNLVVTTTLDVEDPEEKKKREKEERKEIERIKKEYKEWESDPFRKIQDRIDQRKREYS